jgi:preprotein translocase subunit YajC
MNAKITIKSALKRGVIGVGIGMPIALAIFFIIYFSITAATGKQNAEMNNIAYMAKLCLSFFLICFVFAASTIVYQIEKLPLAYATAIHFTAIFACWMLCAWFGGWIGGAWYSWLIAMGTFILIYIIVWLSIVRSQKKKAAAITKKLKDNQ